MKRIILTGFLSLSVLAMFGQNSKVRSAEYLANTGGADNIEKAKEDIAVALQHPDTQDGAKTWYVAGLVYDAARGEEQNKEWVKQPFDKQVRGESVVKAYDYFVKAYELDQQPNEKGKVKPKYDKEIVAKMKNYQGELVDFGSYWYFDQKDYNQALAIWEKYLNMAKIPFMAGIVPSGEADSMYIKITYFSAIAAMLAENTDKAILHLEAVKDKFNPNDSYQYLSQQYLSKQDTASYFNTIKTGFEKYPNNQYMLESLINYYVYNNKNLDEAVNYLNEAIKLNPQMSQYYYARGTIYEAKGQQEDALKDFQKTLELDPKNANAYAGLGRYSYNKGEAYMGKIDNIRDVKIFEAEKAKAIKIYKESAEYFEKARELNPKEGETLRALKRLYYKIYQDPNHPKYVELDKALKDL